MATPTGNLVPQTGAISLTPFPSTGIQTTTPLASNFKPNTPLNISYGASTTVPTGTFTSNPTQNFAGLVPAPNASTGFTGLNFGTSGTQTRTPTVNTGQYTPQQMSAMSPSDQAAYKASLITGIPFTPSTGNTTSTPPVVQPPQNSAMVNPTGGSIGTPIQAPTQAPNITNPGLIGNLTTLAQQGTPEVITAQNNYQKAVQDLADFKKQLAAQYAGIESTPIPIEFQQGREQVIGRQNASVLDALQSAVTQAQQGITQAQTAQGQQLGALGTAAGFTQPQSQFGVLTNPQTGQPISGGSAGSAAFQGGYVGGQQAAGGTAAQMNVANTAAKGIQGTIQQYLQSNPQLNASGLTIANAAQQWLQGKQLGDPAYQTLFNYLNEYISTLAPILGVGGDTTNLKTQIAQSFINAQASGQSISQVLQSIGTLADQKLANIISAGQGGGQVAGGTPTGSTPTSFGTSW